MNVAHKHGFYFHHAKDNYVLMVLWMDKSVANRMPGYADHYVGLGGVVINNKNQILLIKENRADDKRKWKLPGGFMNP